jgi:hypothetical protein
MVGLLDGLSIDAEMRILTERLTLRDRFLRSAVA